MAAINNGVITLTHKTIVTLTVVEELFESKGLFGRKGPAMGQIWTQLPQDLVERVLLFLPATSQARFKIVCRRWKEVITSKAFWKQTVSIAICRSYPFYTFKFGRLKECSKSCQFKVREVDFPGLMLLPHFLSPARLYPGCSRVFTQTSLPLVGLACWCHDSTEFRCCLLSLTSKTWQELPRIEVPSYEDRLIWRIWLVPDEGSNFKVFFMFINQGLDPESRIASFNTYLSGSNAWETVQVTLTTNNMTRDEPLHCQYLTSCNMALTSRGKHIVVGSPVWPSTVARFSWPWKSSKGLSPLPKPLHPRFQLLSDCDTDAIFAYGQHRGGLFLDKFDEENWLWECLVSKELPPSLNLQVGDSVTVYAVKAQIVGTMVLVQAKVFGFKGNWKPAFWTMAYDTKEQSCEWLRIINSEDTFIPHASLGSRF